MMTVSWCQLCLGVQAVTMAQSLQGMDALFSNGLWADLSRSARQGCLHPHHGRCLSLVPPALWENGSSPNHLEAKAMTAWNSLKGISWIVSWKWDLRFDHSAQHPGLLSESLEWFWIYSDVKTGRINPFFPTLAHNEDLPAQFTVLVVLFPPISSLPHILQILPLYMKNRSFWMAPVGAI